MPVEKIIRSFTLDEDTIDKLDKLVKMSSSKTNKSEVLRELISKEYALRMGARNA